MGKKQKKRPAPQRQPLAAGIRWERFYWPLAGCFLALIAFFCFYKLGQLPARDWDEARHGVSAYEMMKNGNYLVNTYQYQPDYYNLKPPVSFWGILLGYRLFGFDLFGMRFYSAAAFLLTSLGILLFVKKRYGRLDSLVVVMLLACCVPFYRSHFARHGDADSLFAAISVAAVLASMLADKRPRALYVSAFCFACAFLTKSWHALYIPLVVAAILLVRGAFPRRPRQWLGLIAAGAGPVLLWAGLRYAFDGTEFFRQMFQVDLLHRTTQVLENHNGGLLFYGILLFQLSVVTGLLPLLAALVYYTAAAEGRMSAQEPAVAAFRRDLPCYLLWFFIPLILFSLARTKLFWYLYPLLFPLVTTTGLLLANALRVPKPRGIRYCAAALCAVSLVVGSVQTAVKIRPPYADPLQEFLHSRRGTLPEAVHCVAYLDVDPSGTMDAGMQKYILLGELYFDWDCKIGTQADFLADPQAKLLLTDNAPPAGEVEVLAAEGRFAICRKV